MIFFLDASALVKLYHDETGAETIRELFGRPELQGGFFVSEIILLEVLVRLTRQARRGGRRERRKLQHVLREHARHRAEYLTVLDFEPGIVKDAESIAIQYRDSGAGTLDLLHAASARQVQETVPDEPLVFVVADRKLRSLVERIGFRILDPEAGVPYHP